MVCNMDCFNCKFSDCINDELEPAPEKRDRIPGSYYDRNRDERIAYQKKYNEEHKEEQKKYQMEYYKRHSDKKKEASKDNYQLRKLKDPDFLKRERERNRILRERKRALINGKSDV